MLAVFTIAVALLGASAGVAKSMPDIGSGSVTSGSSQQQPLMGGAGIPPEARGKASRDVPMGQDVRPPKPDGPDTGERSTTNPRSERNRWRKGL